MVTNIDFQNSDLNEMIQMKIGFVEDAIDILKNPQKAQTYISKLVELIETASTIYPDEETALNAKLQSLLNRVSQPEVNQQGGGISSEDASFLPPAGIVREGSHCSENSIAQLLVGAPDLIPECLRPKMNAVHSAQVHGHSVPKTFGPEFRQIVGKLLPVYSLDGSSQNDVIDPLSRIIEEADKEIHFQRTIEYPDEFSSGEESDTMIRLDMSKGEPFSEKFLQTFHTEVEGGPRKSLKFTEAPSDLVVAANRQIHSEDGTQVKVSRPIQDVPQELVVDSELTVDEKGALYEITGCIIHSGTDDDGHYTVLRKVGDTWYHIDDDRVEEITNPEELLSHGYVFHYRKIETPEISAQEEHFEIEEEASFTCYDILKSIWASVWKPFEVIDQTLQEKKDV